jgi:hypothetical protein
MLPWTMQTGSWLRIAVPYKPGHLGSVRFRKTGGVTRSHPSTLLPAGTAARCDALPIAIAFGRCHTYALFGPREWVFRKRRRRSHYQHCADRYYP